MPNDQITQLLQDSLREHRIRELATELRCAHAAGDKARVRSCWEQMRAECLARSDAQIHRMESRMGVHHA